MQNQERFIFKQFIDQRFWGEMNPHLTIDGKIAGAPKTLVKMTDDEITKQKKLFAKDGYVVLQSLFKERTIQPLRKAIENLVAKGCLPIFAFLYDEFWELVPQMQSIVEQLLEGDFHVESNFWAFHVKNKDTSQGFFSHRDSYSPLIDANGRPQAINLWFALTEADPLNSCVYVLPLSSDPNYPHHVARLEIPRHEYIRALPASAGSVVGFTPNIIHWGSRSSDLAAHPRISVAIEVQRKDAAPILPPLWEKNSRPNYQQRLKLIGRQILLFKHHYNLNLSVVDFARQVFTMA